VELLFLVGIAVVAFTSTNIDDLFVVLAFFATPHFRSRDVVLGQFIGIAVLLGASAMLSLVSLIVSEACVGLLGLVPISIGGRKLFDLWRGEESGARGEVMHTPRPRFRALTVAAVTIANGGDNIVVYTPLFAGMAGYELAWTGLVSAAMTALWCGVAYRMVTHPTLGVSIRRYGHRVVPFVLIALGVLILHDAGSFSLWAR